MGHKFEAAMAATSPESLEMDEPAAGQARPERWSIRRMLAVSALVSMALWTLIFVAVVGLVN